MSRPEGKGPTFRSTMLRVLVLLALASLLPGVCAAQVVRVLYMERPPYYETRDGQPAGFLNEMAAEILRRAGIEAVFESEPSRRILRQVKDDQGLVCSVGWFKTPERETFATFSRAFHQDPPLVALTTVARRPAVVRCGGLAGLLADRTLTLGVISGFSYGQQVDRMIDNAAPNLVETTGSQGQLVSMLAAGRLDYLLIAPVEVHDAIRAARLSQKDLAVVALKDAPPGNVRHIMCNRSFPPDLMRRLDAAIAAKAGDR